MDIGQLKNPFSSKENKKDPVGSGLFKIGDYDEPQSKGPKKNTQADEPSLARQASASVRNGAENIVNKVTGEDNVPPQKS